MSALSYDLATVGALWRRDLLRFVRQPSRVIGSLAQPLIFWLVIGGGMASTFRVPGLGVDYLEYFFPGVAIMVLLFASIFASVGIIEDRAHGFLQAVLAAPGSRAALVVGKSLGSATVALLQTGLFLLLAPAAGYSLARVDWPLLCTAVLGAALGLVALGFAVAWLLDSVQAYHAIQMTLLVPLWVLSGAMFPGSNGHPVFAALMAANPIAYAVSAARHALYGGQAPAAIALTGSPWLEVLVVCGFALVTLTTAVVVCKRRG